MSRVTLSGYIVVPDVDMEVVAEALLVHIEATRAESGCLKFSVEAHGTEVGRYDVYEEFKTLADFEFHQERVKSSAWGKVTKNVVRYYTVEGVD